MDSFVTYEMMDELGSLITTADIVYNSLTFILGIAAYILRSIGLYSIAKRRGIANPWLAWIPVAWVWVLGSISDQFRYVTKAQVKSKRKVLLITSIIYTVLALVMIVLLVVNCVEAFEVIAAGTEEQMLTLGLTMLFQMLGMGVLVFAASIVYAVFYYMAMYDLYTSVNPPCNVLFLVLSIIFQVTAPFFIFFNRKRDGGMPPRCDVPQEPLAGYTIPERVSVIPTVVPPVAPVEEPAEEPVEEPAEESAEETPAEE